MSGGSSGSVGWTDTEERVARSLRDSRLFGQAAFDREWGCAFETRKFTARSGMVPSDFAPRPLQGATCSKWRVASISARSRIDRRPARCYFLATPMTPNVLEFRAFSGSSCSLPEARGKRSGDLKSGTDWKRRFPKIAPATSFAPLSRPNSRELGAGSEQAPGAGSGSRDLS